LDKAVVKKHATLAPGAVLAPGKVVPSGQLWAGVPAKYVRELTAEEIAKIKDTAAANFELSSLHKEETKKDYKTVVEDEEDYLTCYDSA
jgi:carbonic anhydrase/acetyltransferase-like protein (isoleucine patch superfamily)